MRRILLSSGHMKEPGSERRKETPLSPALFLPAVESFASPAAARQVWPKHVAENKEFIEQIESRRVLNERLDAVLSRLPRPDVPLKEAVAGGQLTETQVADLFTSLSALLENGPDYERIILYLPFEFLPGAAWDEASEETKQAAARFRAAYLSAWNRLLHAQDVRANFVDGDVLEVELRTGDLPRVVKAAHLIPKLVEHGIMNMEDVLALMGRSTDDVLKRSIEETLPVLADMGLMPREAADQWETSRLPSPRAEVAPSLPLQQRLRAAFQRADTEEGDEGTERRNAWLRQEKKRAALASASDEVSAAIARGDLDGTSAAQFATPEAGPEIRQAFVDGVRKAVEAAAHTDLSKGLALFADYRETLLSLWRGGEPGVQEAIRKTFCRLHGLRVVDDAFLETLNIHLPKLAGPFSENAKAMGEEMEAIRRTALAVGKTSKLAHSVYPVALVYGSKLKGYGKPSSDTDTAVFVKPETPMEEKETMRARLDETFAQQGLMGGNAEFWLEKTAQGLGVRGGETADPLIAEGSWTHVLFGALWTGDPKVIAELRAQLLVPYLYDAPGKTVHGLDARKAYLEELERDTLQYRLMHKGYAEFFPAYGGIRTPHAGQIDGDSTFWDSGYRQTATKLFASRVFLPKISRP